MQNHTWPRRLPKMVPITIDFEGRGGAVEAAVEDDVEEAGEEGWLFLVAGGWWWWSEKGMVD